MGLAAGYPLPSCKGGMPLSFLVTISIALVKWDTITIAYPLYKFFACMDIEEANCTHCYYSCMSSYLRSRWNNGSYNITCLKSLHHTVLFCRCTWKAMLIHTTHLS